MHILVAEDDRDIAELVAHYARKEGWHVHVSEAGDAALAYARQQPVDLVILDLMLPGLSGLDVCRRVNSPRVKVVYDIYHVQVADGDVTRIMRDNFDWICHIHVAGVPGRLEIDDRQELNYRFIANAIADLGYTGVVAHEWRPGPGRDPIKSLEECFKIIDV